MAKVITLDHLNETTEEIDIDLVFNRYYKRVYNYVYYRVNSHHAAEELTSDIFHKVFVKRNTFDGKKGLFEVWLFSIARNVITDHFRKKNRFKFLSLDSIKEFRSRKKEPERLILEEEMKDELIVALGKLNEKDRNILALKYGSELKNTEIAQILNVSYSNVGVSIHRALSKLKKEVNMEGILNE